MIDLSKSFNPVPKNKRIKNKKLLKDKKGVCEICYRRTQTEKHHIKTKGSGGNDTEENLIELCRSCHTKVHTGEIKIERGKEYGRKKNVLKNNH